MFYIRILIIAEMEPRYELLDPLLDAKHLEDLFLQRGRKKFRRSGHVLRRRRGGSMTNGLTGTWFIYVMMFLNFSSVVLV